MPYDEMNGADNNMIKQSETSMEQDIQELEVIDKHLSELVEKRYSLVDRIQAKHRRNHERMSAEREWFEGSIRGNPVPERDSEGAIAPDFNRQGMAEGRSW